MRGGICRRHKPADAVRDRAHGRASRDQLAAGSEQSLEELGRRRRGLGRDLEQRLDRPPGHPAASMSSVGAELFDRLGKRGHATILTGGVLSP